MTQGALDRARFEAIEAYVLRRLSAEERLRFERELDTDPDLRAELELQREHILAVELGGMDRMLAVVRTEHAAGSGATRGGGWANFLKYAAAVAVLATIAAWWVARPPLNERLFSEHFTADPGLPVAMSATDDHAFQDAMVAYKLGDHEEARSKWSMLLQAEPTNDTLRYYIACSSLALGDAKAAIPLFEGITNEPTSTFQDKSRWQLFMAYLKAGEVAKASAMPLDEDPVHGERIRAIKAAIR